MAELHPQKENYLYSEIYNDSIRVTTITRDSTDVKYADTDSGLCTRTTGHFDSSEAHVIFDKGSYYLGVYHENFGIIEEDGDSIEIAAVSYRTNGINSQFNESYCIAAYVGSEQLTSDTFPGSSTSITIPRNTSNSSRNIYITTKQVYSNLICGQGVDQGGVVEQHGAWNYIVTSTFVNTSTIKDTVTPNGNVDNTKYPNIPATTQIKFQLEQSREGGGYSPTTHCIYEYLDYYNTQPNPEWSNQLGNGNYWNITVASGTQQTGTAQIVSVEFEQGTDVHTRQERNPNYDVNAPAGSPNSNYYITVTYTRRCWYVDHCIVTVKGNSTKYGNYTGNTIDTLSTTTVDINGNWTGQPNYSLPGNWSGTAHLKVKDNHPKYDYSLVLIPNTANTPPTQTVETNAQSTLCFNSTRDVSGTTFQKTRNCTVMLSQRTCTGYIGAEQWGNNWETASTVTTNFTWTSSNTTLATVSTSGVVTAHNKFAVADGQTTITVAINSSTLNKQGIVYTATSYGGTKSSLTKTQDTKIFYILGRADEYTWQLTAITPASATIYDRADTISGHTPKQATFQIYLQEQKNEGKTNEGGYSYQNSSYSACNKFTWTGDNIITFFKSSSASNAIFEGENKNFYPGQKSETPQYITGTITATPNLFTNITKTDTLHKVYGTSNNIVKDYTTNVTALTAKTASLNVRGYMAYYCFYMVNTLSPTPQMICVNNSRTDKSGYGQTATFTASIKYKYTTGKITDSPHNWSGEQSGLTPSVSDFTWSGASANYFTLSNGVCTVVDNSGGGYNGTGASSFSSSRSDQNFQISAALNTNSSFYKSYNTESCGTNMGTATGTLTVLAREDEYTCNTPSVTQTTMTSRDGYIRVRLNATWTITKNRGQSTINCFGSVPLTSGSVTHIWQDTSSGYDSNKFITLSSSSGNQIYVEGTNNYYNATCSNFGGSVHFEYNSSAVFTGKFNASLSVPCGGYIQCIINVPGHANEYRLVGYECSPGTIEIDSWNGSVRLNTTKTVATSTGIYGSPQWNDTNLQTVSTGNYMNGGTSSNTNIASYSGGYAQGNYSSLSSIGWGECTIQVWYHEPGDKDNSNTWYCTFTVRVKPRPDEASWSKNVDSYFYDELVYGDTDTNFMGTITLSINGTTVETWENDDASWTSDNEIEIIGLNRNYTTIRMDAWPGDYGDVGYDIECYYSWDDRNYSIHGSHSVSRRWSESWRIYSVYEVSVDWDYSVSSDIDHIDILSVDLDECYDSGGYTTTDPPYGTQSGAIHVRYYWYDQAEEGSGQIEQSDEDWFYDDATPVYSGIVDQYVSVSFHFNITR